MKKLTILSMNGGGTRGVLQAQFLQNLESECNTSICDIFDFFSGVSIGGLHSLLFAAQDIPAAELLDLYFGKNVQEIFSKNSFWKIPGIFSPKYKSSGKTQVCQKMLGDKTLLECKKHVLVNSYDCTNKRPVFFSTFSSNTQTLDTQCSSAADATSAAPTYFSPVYMKSYNGFFIDGGVISKDSSMSAFVEARKSGYALDNIKILSLGTGGEGGIKIGKEILGWGAAQWLTKGSLIEKLFSASTSGVIKRSQIILGENFMHIPFDLGEKHCPLDSVNIKDLYYMASVASKTFEENKDAIKEFLGLDPAEPIREEGVIVGVD